MSHLPSGAGLKAKLKTEIETPKTGEGVTKALPGVPTTKSTAVPLQSLRPSTMHPAKTALPPVKIDGGGGGTPPDAALAVGSGFVVHAINSIIDVHHADGSHPAGYPKSAHDFWCEGDGLPGCNSGDPSDPRLVYDTSSQHFVYVTLLIRNSKAHFTWLAVSRTSDPTALWDRYAV
jgi:hypothetical protein